MVKVIGLYSCFKTFVDALELLVILVRAAADGQLGAQRLEYRAHFQIIFHLHFVGLKPVDHVFVVTDVFGAHDEGTSAGLLRDISCGSEDPQGLSEAAPANGQLCTQLLLGRQFLSHLQII